VSDLTEMKHGTMSLITDRGELHVRAVSKRLHYITVSNDGRYLSAGQIRERYGVSDMWLWRHMRDHGFPRPVRFGGPSSARHWLISDIEQWERQRRLEAAS
jgi:predicted DNA-binding transcriptional regulator AlpA